MAPIDGCSSLVDSIVKKSKNLGAKKINNDILVDAGLSLLGNFNNNGFGNNSNK